MLERCMQAKTRIDGLASKTRKKCEHHFWNFQSYSK